MEPILEKEFKNTTMKKKIIVGNVDGESLVGDVSSHTPEMKAAASIVANRLTWLIEEGDILLLPYPISKEFLKYVCKLMQIDPETINLVSTSDGSDTALLTISELNKKELIDELNSKMKGADVWDVEPYYYDRGVSYLINKLEKTQKDSYLKYLLQGGAETLNSKAEFRRMAVASNIPIAIGLNCFSRLELLEAVKELITITKSVIIKQDVNAGGDGNIVLTINKKLGKALGARETIYVDNFTVLEDHINLVWEKLYAPRNHTLIAEVYYKTKSVFYSELKIEKNSFRPTLLNFGDMRMEPVWNGFEIPTTTLNAYSIGEFINLSTKLADVARERGYIGNINIDGILTTDNKMMITEINGRNGGCTHIHHVATKLYGIDYANNYTILTRNKVKVNICFDDILHKLRSEDLLVETAHQEGIIILTEDIGRLNEVEYMIVGSTLNRAKTLELKVLELLKRGY